MTTQEALFKYTLRIGDNDLILGHRLAEWCSYGPTLEEDLALTNIALDLTGEAQALLQYAGEVEGKGRLADDLAYKRPERQFYNSIITELPKGDFGYSIVRQFLFDAYELPFYQMLTKSKDETLSAIAHKAVKEVKYHLRHSANWVVRLGDGTEESHNRVQKAVNDLWEYTGELFEMDEVDELMLKEGIGVDLALVKAEWDDTVNRVLSEATLTRPEDGWMQTGAKREGIHSEYLGYILAEMQYLPRAYPDAQW